MAKNAYLIISDMHLWYKNLRSRVNYRCELNLVWDKIHELAKKYSSDYNIKFLFLGDVFHRGYDDVITATIDTTKFFQLREMYGEIYSVIGNHELSYYKDNIFFTLVKDIKSEKIKAITNKNWTARGIQNIIQIPDVLDDGEVHFYFNHYGTGITEPTTEGVNIGLFHQDLLDSNVKKIADDRVGRELFGDAIDIEKTGVLNKYTYSFLGHMHQLFGTYRLDSGSIVCYLGSLGRTNVEEVNDSFLSRDIPVVLVEDGKLARIDNNKFNLMERSKCVLESDVQENKENYARTKEIQQIRNYTFEGDNPTTEIYARLGENQRAISITKELTEKTIDSTGEFISSEVRRWTSRR